MRRRMGEATAFSPRRCRRSPLARLRLRPPLARSNGGVPSAGGGFCFRPPRRRLRAALAAAAAQPQRYAPLLASSRAAAASVCCGTAPHYSPLLRLPRGGTSHGTQSAQQSAGRSPRPGGRAAPASCWAASSFCSPVGRRNELRSAPCFGPIRPQGQAACRRLRPRHG
jgi:hypothetical protein